MNISEKHDAYWLKDGTLHPVESTHISFIIDNPNLFAIGKNELLSIYQKYNEPLRFEGKARIEIIGEVSKHGWIRIRHYKKPDSYWSIQADEYRKRKDHILWFIRYALDNLDMNINDCLKITGYYDNTNLRYDFTSGGVKKYIENNSND